MSDAINRFFELCETQLQNPQQENIDELIKLRPDVSRYMLSNGLSEIIFDDEIKSRLVYIHRSPLSVSGLLYLRDGLVLLVQ